MRPLLVLLATLLLAAPANASFSGHNGDLVVSLNAGGGCEIGANLFRETLSGKETQLTDVCATEDDLDHSIGEQTAMPDGSAVLAVLDDDIVLVPLGGSAPTKVGTGSGPLSVFPDGQSYLSGRRQVFFDGRPPVTTLARGAKHAVLSPDGRWAAARRGNGLWLYSIRTAQPIRKLAKAYATVDWSPDSRRLVYATDYQQREVEGGASGGNLFVVGRDGKHRRSLVHREDIAETHPAWSPDGKSVAWVSLGFSAGDVGFRISPSLWRVSVRTGKRTRIAKLAQPFNEEGYYHAPELTWLPR